MLPRYLFFGLTTISTYIYGFSATYIHRRNVTAIKVYKEWYTIPRRNKNFRVKRIQPNTNYMNNNASLMNLHAICFWLSRKPHDNLEDLYHFPIILSAAATVLYRQLSYFILLVRQLREWNEKHIILVDEAIVIYIYKTSDNKLSKQ